MASAGEIGCCSGAGGAVGGRLAAPALRTWDGARATDWGWSMPRSPLATGVLLSGSQPARDMVELVGLAEWLGYDFLWYADEKFFRDPFVSLAVAAQHT